VFRALAENCLRTRVRFQNRVNRFFSLAPGFSPVTRDDRAISAASAAFNGREKPLKRLGHPRSSTPGLEAWC